MELFVYGTLTEADTAASLLDTVEYRGRAVLDGLHRVDGAYPTLLPGGETVGRILVTDAIEVLDRYEGVEDGLYVRVQVPKAAGGHVEMYVGDPDRLGVDATWPGSGPFSKRVRQYVCRQPVILRNDGKASSSG